MKRTPNKKAAVLGGAAAAIAATGAGSEHAIVWIAASLAISAIAVVLLARGSSAGPGSDVTRKP